MLRPPFKRLFISSVILLIVSFFSVSLVFPQEEVPVSFKEGRKLWQETTIPEYEALLKNAKVRFPKRLLPASGAVSLLGPAAIQLRDFNSGPSPSLDFWTRILILPNIQRDRSFFVSVLVSHVWNEAGEDLYLPQETLRHATEQFKKDKDLTLLNTVRLRSGATKASLKNIEGQVVFSMPLSLEIFKFDALEMEGLIQNTALGSEIELLNVNLSDQETWMEWLYSGPETGFLTVLAFDEKSVQLRKKGFSKNKVSRGWHYAYSFSGKAHHMKTILSGRHYKRSYPFSIKP